MYKKFILAGLYYQLFEESTGAEGGGGEGGETPTGETQGDGQGGGQADPKPDEGKGKGGATAYWKEKWEQSQKESQGYQRQLEDEKTNKMKENQQWKELYEQEKAKREDMEYTSQRNNEVYINTNKTSAVKQEALKMGIRPEAIDDLEDLDKSTLEVETTSMGNMNVIGAKEYVENLKLRKPHWFTDSTPPKYNNANPNGNIPKPKTAADILKLQKTDPDAYNKAMRERLGWK
jgi:hypothetical protein